MDSLKLVIAVLFGTFVVCHSDDACPPSNDIAPCTCDGEGFSCLGNIGIDQIRKAFRAKFKYGGVRGMWIQAVPIKSIPSDLFNNIMVQEAYIEVTNITSIDLQSLKGSNRTLFMLSLYGNQLTTFDFANLGMFQILTTLNLGRNKLTTIPNNAFKSFFLRNLILAQNEISTIGQYAFNGLDNIQMLELSMNRITTLGDYSFSLKSQAPQISLVMNRISSISNRAFANTSPQILRLAANQLSSLPEGAFSDLVDTMDDHQGVIDVSVNPFTCKGCDYVWLTNYNPAYQRVILGFSCPSGEGLDSLNRRSIGC